MFYSCKEDSLLFNLDWVQLSILMTEENPELICPDGFRMEIMQGNNIYKNRMILYDTIGDKMITMLWCPFSNVLNKYIATIQIANRYLYVTNGIQYCMDILHSCFDFSFNSFGRIDVCVDFIANTEKLSIIRGLFDGNLYLQAKSEGSQFWHSDSNGAMFPHCLSWGRSSSAIKVKLYNKSREQGVIDDNSVGEKPWIVEQWRDFGLPLTKIWRCEFSLVTKGKLQIEKNVVGLEDILKEEWKVLTFCGLYAKRFIVRRAEGRRTEKNNGDTIIDFLKMPQLGFGIGWKQYEKKEDLSPIITLLRKQLTVLDSDVCRGNDIAFHAVANSILAINDQYKADWYFSRQFGVPAEMYIQQLYNESGEGIHQKIAKPSERLI